MCGLSGVLMLDAGRTADPETAARMARVMLHRGPDAGAIWAEGPITLAHRRLKIIDLSERGAQPMFSRDRRHVIVFNGEIYNYRELRRELAGRGVEFASESDTEVLLHLYAAHGAAMLPKLDGIFAFAIWDRVARRLFVARDQLGVKPLYYAIDDERLIFASEMKAIVAAGWAPALDTDRVGELLRFGSTAGGETLFRGVRRLAPGTWLEKGPDRAAPRTGRYFDLLERGERSSLPAVEAVQSSIEASVVRQMVSDVPVGAMCSGGIDSSLIASLSARQVAGINTFCIRIAEERFDESSFGRAVSEYCGSRHHELETRASDVTQLLPTMVWLHDEPLTHPNSVPIFQISRLAREHVVVLLSGEGADELFAGYSSYRRFKATSALRSLLPARLAKVLRSFARHAPRRSVEQMVDAAFAQDPASALLTLAAKSTADSVRRVAPDIAVDDSVRMAIAEQSWRAAGGQAAQAALFNDQQTHLLTLLDRQDKMCMGASIESRVPFLDVQTVRLANSLPDRTKLSLRRDKIVLREAARAWLPEEIRTRPKWAFGLPLTNWFRGGGALEPLVDTLRGGLLEGSGVVSRSGVATEIDDARAGRSQNLDLLWSLVNLEIWMRVHVAHSLEPQHSEIPAWRPGVAAPATTVGTPTGS